MVVCIVVAGPPCAGKSTLAALVAARTGWPLLAKDDYKERVFERLGARDREWSRRVSALAWDLLLAEAGRLLGAGVSCVLEGNFREPQRRALAALPLAPAPSFVEIRCGARPDVLVARYRARAHSGSRHPGHVDLEALPELAGELAAGGDAGTALGGPALVWDNSAGFAADGLLAALDAVLARLSVPASGTRGSASCRPRSRRGS
jgi:predicted kinase